jgi:hypothetical protein
VSERCSEPAVCYAPHFRLCYHRFLWLDKRNNFHIINHRYSNDKGTGNCYKSILSAHGEP